MGCMSSSGSWDGKRRGGGSCEACRRRVYRFNRKPFVRGGGVLPLLRRAVIWEVRLGPLLGVLNSWMEQCIVAVRGHHHDTASSYIDIEPIPVSIPWIQNIWCFYFLIERARLLLSAARGHRDAASRS